MRDPLDFWDFFDVWTHPSGAPGTWQRDHVINMAGDVLAVTRRLGPGPIPPPKQQAIAQALTPPISDAGYHIAFDRGAQTGPNAWNRAGPDGSINVPDDILGVASQFGHSCA